MALRNKPILTDNLWKRGKVLNVLMTTVQKGLCTWSKLYYILYFIFCTIYFVLYILYILYYIYCTIYCTIKYTIYCKYVRIFTHINKYICDALRDLVRFVQFKKRERVLTVSHGRVLRLVKLQALLKVTLLRGSFSRFLSCASGTKSCKASHMVNYSQKYLRHG